MVFEPKDKEIFRKILRNQEAFSGVRIVTYCLMSNHFHLLLEVPDRETLAPLDEEGLLTVLPLLYSGEVVEGVKQELERARAAGDEPWHREIRSRYERRRGDLGLFLKEVKLRITARAATPAAAQALLVPVEAELRQRTGSLCYGADGDSLASVLVDRLRQRGETLAVAESCTGGGLGAALAAVPGASDVFLGGVIAYANAVKQELLGVPADLLQRHGAVSDPVARAMAQGVQRLTGATWTIAVTGIAGPAGGSAEKPVGTVYIAVAGPAAPATAGECQSGLWQAGATRGRAWTQAVGAGEALNRLRLRLDALAADSSPGV